MRFNTNGSEAARIDSSGNLHVGKTASGLSTAGLSLRGDVDVAQFTRDGNDPLNLNRLSTQGSIVGFYYDSTLFGQIGVNSSDNLYFSTVNTGFKIADDENAIIPANSDGSNSDNDTDLGMSAVRFKDAYFSNRVYTGGIAGENDTNTQITFPGSDVIKFLTGGGEAARITSGGSVGIGTSGPSAILHVDAPNTTAPSLTFGAAAGQIFQNENSELAIGLSSSDPYPLYMQGRTSGNASRNISLQPLGGNVGIGTDSPQQLLSLKANNPGGKIRLEMGQSGVADGDVTGEIQFYHNDASGAGVNADIKGICTNSIGAGALTFGTGTTSTTERLRITSDGLVGIGTDSPTIASSGGGVHIQDGTQAALRLDHYLNGGFEVQSSSGTLMFYSTAASAERLRIDSSSRMMFNTGGSAITAGGGTPQLSMNFSASVGPGLTIQDTAATNGNAFVRFVNAGTYAGQISSNGGTSMTYGSASDHRLKENVEDMTGAITRVKSLQPRRFSWIADNLDAPNFDGFLAHEAQAVVPEAVTGTKDEVETWTQQQIDDGDAPDGTSAGDNKLDGDGNTIPVMQGIDQSKLVPLLTGALQEAIAKIEDLEIRLAALEGA
jgi:hypothetical protein